MTTTANEKTAYTTTIFSDTMGVRADFAQASDTIYALDGTGEWQPTQYQVADFRHSPTEAMRHFCEQLVRDGGDDPADYTADIDAAVAAMKR